MIRDRCILWAMIVALGALMLAQLIGNGMINHWQAQGDALSKPDPKAVRMLAL